MSRRKDIRRRPAPAVSPNVVRALPGRGLSLADVRRAFGPADTVGTPPKVRAAMDAALEASGAYSLIQHAYETGGGFGGQFLGYAILSGLTQNALLSACVTTVADDMTRAWVTFARDGAAGGDDRVGDLAAKLRELGAQKVMAEAAQLTGWFGGCLIYIDTGETDPEKLMLPLNVGPASQELKGNPRVRFVAVEPVNCCAGAYNCTDPLAPDYYKPSSWYVLARQVHASRFIHVHGDLPPVLLRPSYNFFGVPHAQRLYDYVLHFQECRAAAARLLTKFSLTTLGTNMAATLEDGKTEDLWRRINFMTQNRDNDGVFLYDRDSEEVAKHETPLSGVTDIVRQSLEFVAAVNGTPAVKLLGISPSGFNATGESDIRNYYDHIAAKQEKELRAGIKKMADVAQVAFFGDVDPAIDFTFNPLSEDDKKVKADIQKVRADTMAALLDRGVISQGEARKALAADTDSGYDDIDPDDLPPLPEGDFGLADPAAPPIGEAPNA